MTLPKKVVILADGSSHLRHLGADRHLIEFDGEPLIRRTARQFEKWADVSVLTNNKELAEAAGVRRLLGSDKSDRFFAADMIRKGLDVWSMVGTYIVFGDVFFTDGAVEILRTERHRDWSVFGRNRAVNAKPWAEYFAIYIGTKDAYKAAWRALEAAANNYMNRFWHRCTAWEWYFEMEGMPYYIGDYSSVKVGPHWVKVLDGTDDIDFVDDINHLRRVHDIPK